jgi:cytochrome c oxidase cbb3-type subunit 2
MNIFNDHKKLYPTAAALFGLLTYWVVIMPALQNQRNNAPLPDARPLSEEEKAGKYIYIGEGCVGCHSQQVRNVAMDKVFGSRPGMASDYANIGRTSFLQNTATLMGTERTGPDLTDIGNRQPSLDWHLMHLFNPRAVVSASIMPAYEWLFEVTKQPNPTDVVVHVPAKFLHGKVGKVIAKKEALQLVAYLQSLRQAPLPKNVQPPAFLYPKPVPAKAESQADAPAVDGKALYATSCQSCHQENGEGLKGAFPPLKGSSVVTGDNLQLYVDIIMNGYDARAEYGVMAPIGANMGFNEHQVAALINYERTAWGNSGKTVTPEEVKKIMDFVQLKAASPQ